MSTLGQRSGLASVFFAFLVSSAAGMLASNSASARELVSFRSDYPAGEIIICQHERRLYFTEGNGEAIRYPIAIGMAGKAWLGETAVQGKYMAPDWSPPAIVARDHPELPSMIPGGSPHNPMGVAALTLIGGEYAIHGTNAPGSVGHFVSHGCIRMYNADITDLYQRVAVGTTVMVTR